MHERLPLYIKGHVNRAVQADGIHPLAGKAACPAIPSARLPSHATTSPGVLINRPGARQGIQYSNTIIPQNFCLSIDIQRKLVRNWLENLRPLPYRASLALHISRPSQRLQVPGTSNRSPREKCPSFGWRPSGQSSHVSAWHLNATFSLPPLALFLTGLRPAPCRKGQAETRRPFVASQVLAGLSEAIAKARL